MIKEEHIICITKLVHGIAIQLLEIDIPSRAFSVCVHKSKLKKKIFLLEHKLHHIVLQK